MFTLWVERETLAINCSSGREAPECQADGKPGSWLLLV